MSSLYIHIPFCLRKCHYCDFFSQDSFLSTELDEYMELLGLELTLLQRAHPDNLPLRTIFFGGGTPSLLSPIQVGRLLKRLENSFGLAADCEISLEANPGTLTGAKLNGYRQLGVNRLSLGVQSLSDDNLQSLGRVHSAAEARQSVAAARAAGFENLSIDLIFALPGQSLAQLQTDVEGLLTLQPEHLSLYGLTIEPGTRLSDHLHSGELSEVDDQQYADSYLLINQMLLAAGFEHYEISNYALPGHRCRHNQVYWHRQGCLALGCGAHSYLAAGWGERWYVPPDLARYRNRLRLGCEVQKLLESFDCQSAMAETIYLALRTSDGLSRSRFKERFGVFPEQAFRAAFKRHAERLTLVDDSWRFDLQGWLLYDHLISSFL